MYLRKLLGSSTANSLKRFLYSPNVSLLETHSLVQHSLGFLFFFSNSCLLCSSAIMSASMLVCSIKVFTFRSSSITRLAFIMKIQKITAFCTAYYSKVTFRNNWQLQFENAYILFAKVITERKYTFLSKKLF